MLRVLFLYILPWTQQLPHAVCCWSLCVNAHLCFGQKYSGGAEGLPSAAPYIAFQTCSLAGKHWRLDLQLHGSSNALG